MTEAALPTTPYKGLIPYEEKDAPFFFGRQPDQKIITANLMARRLTLFYGPSGVGKSSVLRAGVAHHLREMARQNLAKRGKPEFAVVVFNRWRDIPLAYLELEVLKSVASALDGQPQQSGRMPGDFVEMLRINSERIGGRLLIILDQFEEYFLYHAQEDGPGTFAAEFPRAINDPNLPISFLISIREDAVAKLDKFEGRIPNLFDNILRIEHLDREAAREAIERPVDRHNQLFEAKDQKMKIEPALVDAVLDQVKTGQVVIGEAGRGTIGGEEGDAQIETPFLQLVMTRLWQEEMRAGSRVLRQETLKRLGGAKRIVETHLDEAMSELSPEEQRIASLIFQHLVTRSRTKIAYPVLDLAEEYLIKPDQIISVVENLSSGENRILRAVAAPLDQPGLLRYEIFHDVLANAILEWRRRYVETQERAETERKLKLEAQARAKAQEQLAREQRLVRQQRWGMVVMATMLLAMIASTWWAFEQRAKAERAQKEEGVQKENAEILKNKAENSLADANKARDDAKQAAERETKQREIAESERNAAEKAKIEANKHRLAAEEAKDRAEDQRLKATLAKEEAEYARDVAEENKKEAIKQKEYADGQKIIAQKALKEASDQKIIAEREKSEAFIAKEAAVESQKTVEKMLNEVKKQDRNAKYVIATFREDLESTEIETAKLYGKDEDHLVITKKDGSTIIWDTEKKEKVVENSNLLLQKLKQVTPNIPPDQKELSVVKNCNASSPVFEVAIPGRKPVALRCDKDNPARVILSSDQELVAIADNDGKARVFDKSGKKVAILRPRSAILFYSPKKFPYLRHDYLNRGKLEGLNSVAFDRNNEFLVTAGKDGTLRVYRVKSREPVAIYLGHTDEVLKAAFSPTGDRIISVGKDQTVRIWNFTDQKRSKNCKECWYR